MTVTVLFFTLKSLFGERWMAAQDMTASVVMVTKKGRGVQALKVVAGAK